MGHICQTGIVGGFSECWAYGERVCQRPEQPNCWISHSDELRIWSRMFRFRGFRNLIFLAFLLAKPGSVTPVDARWTVSNGFSLLAAGGGQKITITRGERQWRDDNS